MAVAYPRLIRPQRAGGFGVAATTRARAAAGSKRLDRQAAGTWQPPVHKVREWIPERAMIACEKRAVPLAGGGAMVETKLGAVARGRAG